MSVRDNKQWTECGTVNQHKEGESGDAASAHPDQTMNLRTSNSYFIGTRQKIWN